MAICFYETPVGSIGILVHNGMITNIYLHKKPNPDETVHQLPLHEQAAQQLYEYFDGERTTFDLPIDPQGTDFMKAVWKALLSVPYGHTVSYGWLAEIAGYSGASRAVGQAMNRNPIPILIPCHRVIGAGGHLTGFGGGMDMKCRMLELEGIVLDGLRIKKSKN